MYVRKEEKKEIFRISKPRNLPYNAAGEIICVCKKRPHLNKSKRENEREEQHTSNSFCSLFRGKEKRMRKKNETT
jgi:hypothetical protein